MRLVNGRIVSQSRKDVFAGKDEFCVFNIATDYGSFVASKTAEAAEATFDSDE
jgi:hypothetical protein